MRFWGSGAKLSRTQKRAGAPGLRKSWCPPSDPQSPVSLALEHWCFQAGKCHQQWVQVPQEWQQGEAMGKAEQRVTVSLCCPYLQ